MIRSDFTVAHSLLRIHVQVGAIFNTPSDSASPTTLFDILLQPASDAGFTYAWINMSSIASLKSLHNHINDLQRKYRLLYTHRQECRSADPSG